MTYPTQSPPETQLPISWYFDLDIYAIEQSQLFNRSAEYIGHELMVPQVGDYHTLAWKNDAQALVRRSDRFELMSNICRHRQAIMLKGQGRTRNIVCPLHRWVYNANGELIAAPHFPENPGLNLNRQTLQNWQGLLFAGDRNIQKDLEDFEYKQYFDFSDYLLDSTEVDEYAFNWKTFIEVYLEDYHVDAFHPGLGNFVDCAQLQWQFGERFSVQSVGLKNRLQKAGSPIYQNWHKVVQDRYGQALPPYGAIWVLYYPNVMLEWYPFSLVISTLIPQGPNRTTNVVEFYYPKDIALHDRGFIEAEKAAYLETALEDDELAQRMTQGRFALYNMGKNQVGPYQIPMEQGMQHFHGFLRQEIVS
jgi:choline monooxygenase